MSIGSDEFSRVTTMAASGDTENSKRLEKYYWRRDYRNLEVPIATHPGPPPGSGTVLLCVISAVYAIKKLFS